MCSKVQHCTTNRLNRHCPLTSFSSPPRKYYAFSVQTGRKDLWCLHSLTCLYRAIWQKRRSILRCGTSLCWNYSLFVCSEEFDPWQEFRLAAFDLHCPSCRWLFRDGLLPGDTYFVGFARSDLTVEDIKAACLPHMKVGFMFTWCIV